MASGIDIRDLGAIAGDVPDYADFNADLLQYALEMAVANDTFVTGAGLFQIGVRSSGTNPAFIYCSVGDGKSVRIRGGLDGRLVLKEKDGKTKSIGRYNKMFYLPIAAGANAREISFVDVEIDKNGKSSFEQFIAARAASTSSIVLFGEQGVDGVSLVDGDRCLVAGQTVASQNGVYVVGTAAWTRAADQDSGAEVIGSLVVISEGVIHAGAKFRNLNTSTITIGSSSIVYSKTSGTSLWEQSHCINVTIPSGAKLERLDIDRLTIRDKTGGGVVVGGGGSDGPLEYGIVSRFQQSGWSGGDWLVSERGDIECQGVGTIDVINSCGRYFQTEPNSTGYSLSRPLAINFHGGRWDVLDLAGYGAADQNSTFFRVQGAVVTKSLNADHCNLFVSGSDWTYSPANSWINVKGRIVGGVCRIPVSGGAVQTSIYPRTQLPGVWNVDFDGVEVTLSDATSGNVTGFALNGNQPNGLAAARAIRTSFVNCTFDPRFEHLIDAYRESGTVIVKGGTAACWGYAFTVGGTTTPHYGFLELHDVDFRGVAGPTVMFSGPTSNFGLRMSGRYLAGEVSFGFMNGAAPSHVDGCAEVILPDFIGDAVPTSGVGLKNTEMQKRNKTSGASPGWVCTTGHVSSGGTWKELPPLSA